MSKAKTAPAFWAIANNRRWAEGATLEVARRRATTKGGWMSPAATEVFIYELDPRFPVTHINEMDGHAIHRPKDSVRSPMGQWSGEVCPYKRWPSGAVMRPVKFERASDRGRWAKVELKD